MFKGRILMNVSLYDDICLWFWSTSVTTRHLWNVTDNLTSRYPHLSLSSQWHQCALIQGSTQYVREAVVLSECCQFHSETVRCLRVFSCCNSADVGDQSCLFIWAEMLKVKTAFIEPLCNDSYGCYRFPLDVYFGPMRGCWFVYVCYQGVVMLYFSTDMSKLFFSKVVNE